MVIPLIYLTVFPKLVYLLKFFFTHLKTTHQPLQPKLILLLSSSFALYNNIVMALSSWGVSYRVWYNWVITPATWWFSELVFCSLTSGCSLGSSRYCTKKTWEKQLRHLSLQRWRELSATKKTLARYFLGLKKEECNNLDNNILTS